MQRTECLAMILAGGKGSRLGVLTKNVAKPAVLFGGKYRIIDFTLSNCRNSGISTVGILTQYQPLELNWYIGNGSSWDLDSERGGAFILPPYMNDKDSSNWYQGLLQMRCLLVPTLASGVTVFIFGINLLLHFSFTLFFIN